MMSLLLGKT